MEITPLFPTAVGKFTFRELTDSEDSFIFGLDQRKNTLNYVSVDSYILEHEELKELKDFFQKSVDEYLQKIYCPENSDTRLRITQSWVNTTFKTQRHHSHTHANSFVSGVFYIRSDLNRDKIQFKSTTSNLVKFFRPSPPTNYNAYNSDTWWLPSEQSTLYIFPSNLEHFVDDVETDEPRISIAFNTFPIGVWGTRSSLSEVIL